MAPSGTVTTYIDGDISGLRTATRAASREFANVGRAAEKANTDAARGSTKALTGISRLVATGKVSAKSLDKIGRSASGAISAVGGFVGFGAALGLIAVPGLAAGAVKAIDALKRAHKGLADRLNDAAAAQRNFNSASLAASGALDAITLADLAAADAHKALSDAQKAGTASTAEMLRLTIAAAAADRDAKTARAANKQAIADAAKAQKEYAKTVQTALDKLVEYNDEGARGKQHLKDVASFGARASQVLLTLSGSNANLTDAQKSADRSLANYIKTANLTPKQIKTLISLSGHGKSVKQLLEFLGLTDKIPPKKNTKVATTGSEKARREIQALRDELAGLHNKNVLINVTTKRSDREGPAVGARIDGRFDGRDNIPVNVSKGEVILNPRQQSMVDRGMLIDQALSATGAMTIRAGGGFAKGGKREDRDMDTFLGIPILNRLALASSTLDEKDDRSAAGVAAGRIQRILKAGKLGRRRLSGSERRMLLEALGGYLRDAQPPTTDLGGGGGDPGFAETDPFALQRATNAGFASGLGRAEGYVFGGLGDIGSGPGTIPALHVESLTFTNSVQNQGQIAQAGNRGNDTLSGGRIRATRTNLTF